MTWWCWWLARWEMMLVNGSCFHCKLLNIPKTDLITIGQDFCFFFLFFFSLGYSQSKQKPLTSNVLHGDGAGSGKFPWHPKGFVTQLLVHQCTWRIERQRFSTHKRGQGRRLGYKTSRQTHRLRWPSSAASVQNTERRWRRPQGES